MPKHDDPTNPTADGQLAPAQGSNFNVKIEDTRNRKVTADAHSSIRHGKGIIASATASHGGRLSSAPDEKSIVTVGGMTLPVSSALREGFLVKNEDGSYSDGPAITGQTGQTAGNADQEGSGLQLPDADETNSLQVSDDTAEGLADLSEALTSIGANPTAVVAEIIKDPEAMNASILNLARSRNMDEGQAFEHVREMTQDVAVAVEDFVLENTNLDSEELEDMWDHARANNSEPEFARAITNLLFVNEPKPLLEMVAAFQRRSR